MNIENIEKVKDLISKRYILLEVLNKFERWSNGHFEFVEHCGNAPNRISITYFPELTQNFIDLIKGDVELIEEELKEL